MLPKDVTDDLLSKKNVKGVGLSPDGEKVIVFVGEKVPETLLDDEDIVPATVQIDDKWYDTDVKGIGEPFAHDARKEKHRPAPAGVSMGHPEISAGTLGSVPLIDSRGREVILTNAHVAAPPGEVEMMDAIIQPGKADGGEPKPDEFGNVVDWSEISKEGDNKSDSALVKTHNMKENEVMDVGQVAGLSTDYNKDTEFKKSGRTTGVTSGSLLATDVTIDVRGYFPNETARFVDVDAFTPMSRGGDSGSNMFEQRARGKSYTHLLFAGSPQSTLAIPMANVVDEHGELEVKNKPEGSPGEEPEEISLWRKILRFFGGLFS